MIRIICTECKNAYLQNKDGKLVCPSCEASYNEECENLLLAIQYYKEENLTECDNCLMKYIVKNGAEPLAVIYKALCDARAFDEDTTSLQDTYKKILDALSDASDEDFPKFIAIANDEAEKIEKSLSESHVRLFADADAETIKKEVTNILSIQTEAKQFRQKLNELVADFNNRSTRKISAKFSDCFYVEMEIAAEVGEIKYQKICDNIASHTVFTGILTNDIKNLEIYYRCVVMFFQKSHDKYEFLLAQAEKFTTLAELLQQGQYNTIKGIGAISDKLKSVSYEFLQDSYKEHFDEQIDMQTETVVVTEPEIIEECETTEEAEEVATKSVEGTTEETTKESTEESTEVIETDDAAEEIAAESNEIPETVTAEDFAETIEADITATDILNEDVIEIEVEEVYTEEKELEEISSTSEVEVVAETTINTAEVTQESAEPDTQENSAFEEETEANETPDNDIIEIEATPQYQVVECNIPEVNDVEETVVEEVVVEKPENTEQPKKAKKKKNLKPLILIILVVILAGVFAGFKYGPDLVNQNKYNKAVTLSQEGKYSDAIAAFNELGDYSDSKDKALECQYNYALELEKDGKFAEAKLIFENLENYGDSSTRVQACAYSEAKEALENKNFKTASKLFMDLGDYGDSKEMVKECSYQNALALIENKEYKSAIDILSAIRKYSDSAEKIFEAKYMYVTDNFDKDNKTTVKYINELTSENYRNSAELRKELLGSEEVLSDSIKAVVNYSSSDIETALTKLDNTKVIYFHAVVGDKNLYGQSLTLKYTTAFGYSQKKTVVLSESDNVAVMSYPSTQHKNYTVTFELLDSTGKKLTEQTISF